MLRAPTTDGPEGAVLEGDDAGFHAVHALVLAGTGILELDAEGDPSPYRRFLRRLVVEEVPGPFVCFVQVVGTDDLLVRCPVAHREVVAANLSLVGVERGYHTHYEWHPDHHHLAADSVPVVVRHL